MKRCIGVSVVILSIAGSGCATTEGLYKQVDETAPGLVLPLAAFELSCPKEKLNMVTVGKAQYGVTGCGKKATWGVTCMASPLTGNIERESCGAKKVTETSPAE